MSVPAVLKLLKSTSQVFSLKKQTVLSTLLGKSMKKAKPCTTTSSSSSAPIHYIDDEDDTDVPSESISKITTELKKSAQTVTPSKDGQTKSKPMLVSLT